MEVLRAQKIVKNYSDVNSILQILKGINFSVEQSDLISVSGSSGSGKSTLLHILGLLDSPTSGEIYYFNQLINKKGSDLSVFRNQHIGFVFQFHYLLNDFTAVENVAIPMYISGKSWKKSIAEASDLLVKMDMYDRLNHYPNQLSGGEQQRTAIARALINRPDIIFADEPTGNLDFSHAQDILNLILRLNQKYGQTFIIATHDQNVCESMKRHYKLDKGVINES